MDYCIKQSAGYASDNLGFFSFWLMEVQAIKRPRMLIKEEVRLHKVCMNARFISLHRKTL